MSAFVYGIQSQILSRLIYAGEMIFFGQPRRCWIYYASRGYLLWKILTRFPMEMCAHLLGRPEYLRRARQQARELESRE